MAAWRGGVVGVVVGAGGGVAVGGGPVLRGARAEVMKIDRREVFGVKTSFSNIFDTLKIREIRSRYARYFGKTTLH
jgi:hypothetical protein